MKFLHLLFPSFLSLSLPSQSFARSDRTQDLMIPMRDGVSLHTTIHLPRPGKSPSSDGRFPTIVDRSPYGYGDMEWVTDIFLPFGYAAVGQDMRGTEKSEGLFDVFLTEADDARDLGDWIVKQPWSDGRIFTFGMSADGLSSIQTPQSKPEWLKGQYVGWAPAKMYEVLFPHGDYKMKTTEDWLNDLTFPDESYHPNVIQLVRENEAHGPFWDQVELSPSKYASINFPSAFWAGWYDLFQQETLNMYTGYNTMSDESVRFTSKLTVDPCGHCLEAQSFWTENIVEGRTAIVLAQIFETYGIFESRREEAGEIKNVTFYVMSSNDEAGKEAGQYWTSLEEWPTPRNVDYFLHSDGTAQTARQGREEAEYTTYAFDPENPVPTVGGNNLPESIGGSIPCGPLDQGEVDFRPDVLRFETDVFSEELPIVGNLAAHLFVSSDAADTDFNVKISDVYPTGEARIIQDSGFRMRWRNQPASVEPSLLDGNNSTVYAIDVNLWNTAYVVAPGHRLRFTVSSSNFPRFSVNPGNGILLQDPEYPGKSVVQTNTLHHSQLHPSKITLPVVSKLQIREVRLLAAVKKQYPELTDEMIGKFAKWMGIGRL